MSIAELIKKVEGLADSDREVDFRLHIALVEDAVWPAHDMKGRVVNPNSRMSDYLATYADVIQADDQDFDFPRYTASLDAAMALAERVLPGVELELTNLYNVARATLHHETGPFYGSSAINSLPIAICLAVLSALPSGEQP